MTPTPERGIEKIFQEYEWLSKEGNPTMHIGGERLRNLKNDIEALIHQELQKARQEAYEHAEIVRQRTLNDIVDMLDEAGDVQGARAVEAMYQSELDQDNK